MALEDLVVSHEKISRELIEGILKGRVELIREGKKVVLTKEAHARGNRARVLLYLAGGRAWELLDDKAAWSASSESMEEILAIPGNTLRPILKDFRDKFLVKSEGGKYQILPKGIIDLESQLQHRDTPERPNTKEIKEKLSPKKSGGPTKPSIFNDLLARGFFDSLRDLDSIRGEFARMGHIIPVTSLPPTLLPLLRKNILTREKVNKGKRTVWAYKKFN
jgi:hypothetical protein